MNVEKTKEHEWLQQLVGEWTFENECSMGPDQPPSKFTGSESVRSLGGIWVLCEGKHETPGASDGHENCIGTTLMTLGYDPLKKRFIGTFVGGMMTHLWPYDGSLDSSNKILTLDSEGPSFADANKMTKYKDVIEIKNADHRVLTSHALGEDGKYLHFMTAHYRRTK